MHILKNWYTNHSGTCLCVLSMDTWNISKQTLLRPTVCPLRCGVPSNKSHCRLHGFCSEALCLLESIEQMRLHFSLLYNSLMHRGLGCCWLWRILFLLFLFSMYYMSSKWNEEIGGIDPSVLSAVREEFGLISIFSENDHKSWVLQGAPHLQEAQRSCNHGSMTLWIEKKKIL